VLERRSDLERALHGCLEVAERLLQAHLCVEVYPLGADELDLGRAQREAVRRPGIERPSSSAPARSRLRAPPVAGALTAESRLASARSSSSITVA
jgi:hypothetical protein